jgi:branched-chain amino acid transport system ATP-binding protein
MSKEEKSLLVVQHLSLTFGSVAAIDDLSFIVRRGEITALIGPEGAGKTSVLNCITGFSAPQRGRIELHCSRRTPFLLERMRHCRIARDARVVRTFRNPRLFTGMTVLDNIMVAQNSRFTAGGIMAGLFALPHGRRARRAEEKARQCLDRVGILHEAGRIAAALTPAFQRRVEIARALAVEPRLICMDEPAAGLSERERNALAEMLHRVARDGVTLLLAAHDPGFANKLADHVIALDHGACVAAGSPAEVAADPAVLRAYLGLPPGGDIVPRIFASC